VTCAPVDDNTLCNRYIIESFPRSQHRPVLLHYGICVPLTESIEKPRWIFLSVDWESFAADIDHVVRFILACLDSCERFSNAIRAASKRHVPRGFRKAYIPGWNQDYENLYQEYDSATANRLLEELNDQSKRKWEKTVESTNFIYYSRKAWSCFGNLVPIRTKVLLPLCIN
jgi:hypothetical protein